MKHTGDAYSGLMVSTWELFRGDTSTWSDRFFYLDVIKEYGGPVLDVGCATGRLLLDYLAQGIDTDGLELSPEMLAICRAKAAKRGLSPTLYPQAMQEMDIPRRYRTIVVSSSSFQLLTNAEQAREALRRFLAHLEPGGASVMSLMIVWQEGAPLDTGWMISGEKVRPEDGATIRRWSRELFDAENQLAHAQTRYEVAVDGQIVASEEHVQSPELRWYTQEQIVQLLQEAGFANIRLRSGFTHELIKPEDTLFTVTAERP